MFQNIQYPIVQYIADFWLIFGFFGLPVLVTIFNVYNLCSANKKLDVFFELITMIFGPLYSGVLYTFYIRSICGYALPIKDEYMLPVQIIGALAFAAYMLLWIFKSKLNGIQTTICYACMYLGIILSFAFIQQLVPSVSDLCVDFAEGILLMVFPLNFIIISLSTFIKNSAALIVSNSDKNEIAFFDRVGVRFILALLFAVVILAIVIGILYLFGYPLDAYIKAFTEAGEGYLFNGLFK